MKTVRAGGEYRGSSSSKYWYSYTDSFKCHYCVQGYHTAKERARHHHSHQEPYKCHDCEYKNVRQDSLSKHLLKKHSKTVNVVRAGRKVIRGGKVPLPNISNSKNIASSFEPDRGVNSTLYVILTQVDTTSV